MKPLRTVGALISAAAIVATVMNGSTAMPRPLLASPHPVDPSIVEVPITTDPSAAGEARRSVAKLNETTIASAPTPTKQFDLVSVAWRGSMPLGATVQVKVREKSVWSAWYSLAVDADHGPDGEEKDAAADSEAEPLLTDDADGVQVRVDVPEGKTAPRDVRAVLVDGGSSEADKELPQVMAATNTNQPAIITRRQWGARESYVRADPVINKTVKVLFVHHTVSTNSYSRSSAYAQMRSMYAYHTLRRKWNDIGYNFVVDRYGRIFEGRRGSITQAVMGAHTKGFNTDSMGFSLMGTHSSSAPSSAATRAMSGLIAWKSAKYFINPRGSAVMTSAGGSGVRYGAGRRVRMNTVSGHRDAYYTDCPGTSGYRTLPWLRSAAAGRMRPGIYGAWVNPGVVNYAGSAIGMTAVTPTNQRWWVSIAPLCGGRAVRTLSGQTWGRFNAAWNLKDAAGRYVPPGVYRMTLTTSSPVGTVRWHRDVEIAPVLGSPISSCRVQRVAGGDPATASVSAGRRLYPRAKTVVLSGTHDAFAALVAGPLSRAKAAPMLYTSRDTLPAVVRNDMAARGVNTAYLVGDKASIGDGAEQQLRGMGISVRRLAGADRYGTAAAVAREVSAPARAAVVISGQSGSWGYSISAAAAATAARQPLLLLGPGGVDSATGAALRDLGVTRVTVVAPAHLTNGAAMDTLKRYGVGSRVWVTGRDAEVMASNVISAMLRDLPATREVSMTSADPRSWAWAALAAAQGRKVVIARPSILASATRMVLARYRPHTLVVANTAVVKTAGMILAMAPR